MDQTARRRRRNLIQNIAIALLSVSAVLLFAQLQLYNLGTSEDPLYLERLTRRGLTLPAAGVSRSGTGGPHGLLRPVWQPGLHYQQ